jgi:hypothetical protein
MSSTRDLGWHDTMYALDEQLLHICARSASYIFTVLDFTSPEAMGILAACVSMPEQFWHSSLSDEIFHGSSEPQLLGFEASQLFLLKNMLQE